MKIIHLTVSTLAFSLLAGSAAIAQQGSGGYPNGAPGADTVNASQTARAHLRKHHMTNDTSGGNVSIDKSGTTSEAGVTAAGVGAHGSEMAKGAHAAGNTGGTKTVPTTN